MKIKLKYTCTIMQRLIIIQQWLIVELSIEHMREGHDYTTLSRNGGKVGCLCSHKLALPHHRVMASLPKRCEVVAGFRDLEQSTMAQMNVMVLMKSTARPPRVSATRGTKLVPEDRLVKRWVAKLLRPPTSRVWLGVWATFPRVCC